jgi:hypothetical protein
MQDVVAPGEPPAVDLTLPQPPDVADVTTVASRPPEVGDAPESPQQLPEEAVPVSPTPTTMPAGPPAVPDTPTAEPPVSEGVRVAEREGGPIGAERPQPVPGGAPSPAPTISVARTPAGEEEEATAPMPAPVEVPDGLPQTAPAARPPSGDLPGEVREPDAAEVVPGQPVAAAAAVPDESPDAPSRPPPIYESVWGEPAALAGGSLADLPLGAERWLDDEDLDMEPRFVDAVEKVVRRLEQRRAHEPMF